MHRGWKCVLVVVLTCSMSGKNLTVKASQEGGKVSYLFFSVSLLVESTKFMVAFVQYACRGPELTEATDVCESVLPELIGWKENLVYLGPALMFTFTNNVLFLIMERLNPATVSLIWNLKIATTAVVLYCCMGHPITVQQWVAVVLLTGGVVLSQASHLSDTKSASSATVPNDEYTTGVLLCLVSIMINVSANVLVEYLFKRTRANQYRQYMNLYAAGVLLNAACLVGYDYDHIWHGTVFQGFTSMTVFMIAVLGLAGFLVGMTFKHLDNIAVVFADVSAMIIVSLLSWLMFDLELTFTFVLGAAICIIALCLYYLKPGVAEEEDRAAYQRVSTEADTADDGVHMDMDPEEEIELGEPFRPPLALSGWDSTASEDRSALRDIAVEWRNTAQVEGCAAGA